MAEREWFERRVPLEEGLDVSAGGILPGGGQRERGEGGPSPMAVSKDTQRAGVRSALRTICYNLGVQAARPTAEDSEALINVLGPEIGETPHSRPAGEQVQNAIQCLVLAIMREGPFASDTPPQSGLGQKVVAAATKTTEEVPMPDDAPKAAKPTKKGGKPNGEEGSEEKTDVPAVE